MYLIRFLILTMTGIVIAYGQNPGQNPPNDLVVLKSSWNRSADQSISERTGRERDSIDVENRTGFNRRLPSDDFPMNREGDMNGGYMYVARVKVTGSRVLSSVEWTMTFQDPKTHSEVGKHSFTTKRKLKPGDEVNLSQFSKMPPATVLDAKRGGDNPPEKDLISTVTIRKVEYFDENETTDKN